MTSKTRKPS